MEDRLDGIIETAEWPDKGMASYVERASEGYDDATLSARVRKSSQFLHSEIRQFDTGATRDSDEGKNDYEGYFSPLFLEAFGDYMTAHRVQSDGSVRAADNWQKGIPIQAYRESLIRHTFTAWRIWRGWPVKKEKIGGVLREPTLIEALCGIFFNVQGMAHEHLKGSSR